MPILEGLDGVEKMSKSLGNYIGVNEDAKVMFKKIMEVPDRLIVRYFELTTDILPEELDKIKEALADGCNPRDVKLTLARTVTALYHTAEETESAEQFYQEAFSKKAIPQEIPVLQIVMEKEVDEVTLTDAIRLLVNGGWAASGSEFRRLVAQGGVQKNGEKVSGMEEVIHTGDVLKIGKKKFVRIEMV